MSLVEVGLAHDDRGFGTFVSCNGIVEIELAGCILLIKRTDTFEVVLCFAFLRPILIQLSRGFVDFCLILPLVDDKQCLVFLDVGSFFKKHLFEKSFYTGVYFDKLLRTYTAYIFSVYTDVVLFGFHGCHDGKFFRRLFFAGKNVVCADSNGDKQECAPYFFLGEKMCVDMQGGSFHR